MTPPQKRERVSGPVAAIMALTAVATDAFQGLVTLIPFLGVALGWGISLCAGLTFYLWFRLQGIPYADGSSQKFLTLLGSSFIEMLPVINSLPGWTLFVVLTIAIVRREDARYNEQQAAQRPRRQVPEAVPA